ncbi:MAG: TetR/AcrR family transcriptional regulator [Kineosporiaceae bacterium]|nr:TetR/AcrR family transcriptional regulator [Aeromicrobium sp.]
MVEAQTSDGEMVSELRNQPVQARSGPTVTAVLQSAASVVDCVGADRLTLELVAVAAGVSIGTVYRYFEDSHHLLDALGNVHLERFTTECLQKISPRRNPIWSHAVGSVLDYLENEFREQPGFRSIRFGDHLDGRGHPRDQTNVSIAAARLGQTLADNYPLIIHTTILHRVEVAVVLYDAMLSRAFALDDSGDPRMITTAYQIAIDHLTEPEYRHTAGR